jgi:hypothetical protein
MEHDAEEDEYEEGGDSTQVKDHSITWFGAPVIAQQFVNSCVCLGNHAMSNCPIKK